jgi:DNA-binding transcriptional LysR family regulator
LVIVVSTEHAWSTTDRLEPDRLIETDWVLREPGSGTRSTFEAALKGFGVSPGALRLALELPSNEAVRAAVEAGLGATAISSSVAAPSLEAGLLHRVRFNLPERNFQVVRHVARCRSRAADALLSMVTAPPGMSSMGKLMALALLCTMAAAVLFQPVLMGRPRQIQERSLRRAITPSPAE